MKNFLSLILIIFFSNLSYAQTSISSARLQPLGSTVTVTGVVTNGIFSTRRADVLIISSKNTTRVIESKKKIIL